MGVGVDRARLFRGASAVGPRAVLHRDPAAERHRPPAHRPRAPAFARRTCWSAARGCRGTRRSGSPAWITRASRRRSSWSGSCGRKGIDRRDIGREAFVERVWAVEGAVRRRDRRPDQAHGDSLDWCARALHDGRRAVPGRPRGVRPLVRRGPDLPRRAAWSTGARPIRRASRTPRWSTRTSTASWSRSAIRSRTGRGSIAVATTRVETMLGDTGIAVHPGRRAIRAAGREDRHAIRSTGGRSRSSPTRRSIPSSGRER